MGSFSNSGAGDAFDSSDYARRQAEEAAQRARDAAEKAAAEADK